MDSPPGTTPIWTQVKPPCPIPNMLRTGMPTPFRRPRRSWSTALAGVLACALAGCEEAPEPGEPIAATQTLGEPGTYPGQFAYPRVLEAGAGDLWVIDKAARVQRIDPDDGASLAVWKMPRFANGKPVGLEVTEDDLGPLLFIADTHEFRVLVERPPADDATEPQYVAEFGSYGTDLGQFVYPTDVALQFGADGAPERIYVSEYGGNDRVTCFDADFHPLFAFGHHGTVEDEGIAFNRPQAIELDPARGELVVADACNHRLGRFTLEGELIAWIGGEPGDSLGAFTYPYGLELLDDGTVLVAEFGNNRVQRIDLETGRSLGSWGRAGRGDGELATPWAIAVIDKTGYVLDSGNNRIIAFDSPAGVRRTSSR